MKPVIAQFMGSVGVATTVKSRVEGPLPGLTPAATDLIVLALIRQGQRGASTDLGLVA